MKASSRVQPRFQVCDRKSDWGMGFDSRPGGSDPRCPRERVVQGVHQQRNAAFANAKITTAAILLRSYSLLKKPQKADLRSAIKQINRATAQFFASTRRPSVSQSHWATTNRCLVAENLSLNSPIKCSTVPGASTWATYHRPCPVSSASCRQYFSSTFAKERELSAHVSRQASLGQSAELIEQKRGGIRSPEPLDIQVAKFRGRVEAAQCFIDYKSQIIIVSGKRQGKGFVRELTI